MHISYYMPMGEPFVKGRILCCQCYPHLSNQNFLNTHSAQTIWITRICNNIAPAANNPLQLC